MTYLTIYFIILRAMCSLALYISSSHRLDFGDIGISGC
jgi:hypothetical protein